MVILGDLDQDRARAQAEKYDIPQWGSSDDVLTHPDVEIIVNLTIPAAHAPVASEAIAAGKHVWSEKPISVDRASGRALLEQAESGGTIGRRRTRHHARPGVQTARRAIAHGDIGVPMSAQTVMQYPGPDIFHPNPEFLFARGRPIVRHGPVLHHHARPHFRTGRHSCGSGVKGSRHPHRPGRRSAGNRVPG